MRRRVARQCRKFGQDTFRTEDRQQIQLSGSGALSAFVCQVYDLALRRAIHRAVWLVNKTFEVLGMPMIAPSLSFAALHALLHHRSFSLVSHNEAVQVKLKAVLHGVAIDLVYHLAT